MRVLALIFVASLSGCVAYTEYSSDPRPHRSCGPGGAYCTHKGPPPAYFYGQPQRPPRPQPGWNRPRPPEMHPPRPGPGYGQPQRPRPGWQPHPDRDPRREARPDRERDRARDQDRPRREYRRDNRRDGARDERRGSAAEEMRDRDPRRPQREEGSQPRPERKAPERGPQRLVISDPPPGWHEEARKKN